MQIVPYFNICSIDENYQTLIHHNSAGSLAQIDKAKKEAIGMCIGHYKEHSKLLTPLLKDLFGYIAKAPHLKSLCEE